MLVFILAVYVHACGVSCGKADSAAAAAADDDDDVDDDE